MISRRSSRTLGEVFARIFRKQHRRLSGTHSSIYFTVDTIGLYDFLYDNEYSPWLCNKARALRSSSDSGTRPLKDLIMKLHTGETQLDATANWTFEERKKLGQQYLADLAEDILNYWHADYGDYSKEQSKELISELVRGLELDGYIYKDSRLLISEDDILDSQETTGVLENLFLSLQLNNKETAFHHLRLSEEHYITKRWDDSISNSRKFLESVLQEVATTYSQKCKNSQIAQNIYTRPVAIRDYLQQEGVLEPKETEALAKIYGLLSHTGGHPYMAQSDQARLLRHLALTFSQFAMLRLQGALTPKT